MRFFGRGRQSCADRRRPLEAQERTKLIRLFAAEVGDVDDMAFRLDHESARAERTDAMLDDPVGRFMDHAAGERRTPVVEIAG